ncbi:MAG: DUF4230 domain-containing protein [Phycisphaerales bacterium]|nr:DUF4230 domain-containing protein [Phycisphaerales bacterium]
MSTTTDILRSKRAALIYAGAVAALALLMALGLYVQQASVIEAGRTIATAASQSAPTPAAVARHVRSASLVTSRLETSVRAQTADTGWNGTVVATVEAPAILSYGVDLSRMDSSRIRISGVGGVCVLTVPPPTRIATEVRTGDEKFSVEVGGLALRMIGGEHQLGLARTRLYEQAARFRPNPVQMNEIRATAREQIAGVVRTMLGEPTVVRVVFEDEQPSAFEDAARRMTAAEAPPEAPPEHQ